MRRFWKSYGRPFVRARKELRETKLGSAKLRENLVREEYHLRVTEVYDFSHGKDTKEVGGFGEVQAVTHRKTGTKYAMKTVKLSGVKSQKAFEFVMKEVDLLKSLDHPNIVRLQEVYMSDSHLHMAMDLITGGNLAGGFRCDGEEQATAIVRQVARALRYLHDRNIAHRDLKLENILIESGGKEGADTPVVKLVDFGLSAIYEEHGVSTDVLGSWSYVAPEVIMGHYHPAPADMWSLGVVTYVLVGDTFPFDADSTEGIQRNILSAKFGFKGEAWAGASDSSKHFVRSLLLKSPHLRLTAVGAQKHGWLRRAEDLSQAPQKRVNFREEVTQSLLDFREANPMKQLALEVVARTLDPAQISLLAGEFDRADTNHNGEVSLSEFKRWLEATGAARGMAEEEVEALFKSVDYDHSGFIHYNEFLAATIHQRQLDEEHLWPAFDRLDRSHTGFINLEDVTLTTGAKADMKESAAILAHFDMNGDGRISFEEFVNGMRRMGGSTRDKGGLLSASPFGTDTSLPKGGTKEESTDDEGGRADEESRLHSGVQGANDGNSNSTSVATGDVSIDREGSHRLSEPSPLQPRSPATGIGRAHHAVRAPDNASLVAPVQDDPKASKYSCGGVSAAGAAGDRRDAERTGNGDRVAISRVEGDGARLEGQGCGCVLA